MSYTFKNYRFAQRAHGRLPLTHLKQIIQKPMPQLPRRERTMDIGQLKTVDLFIAEEMEIYREIFRSIFQPESRLKLLGIADNHDMSSVFDAVSKYSPDILLIGTKQLDNRIIEELKSFRENYQRMGIVLLITIYQAESVRQLRSLAARGKAGMAVFLRQSFERVDQIRGIVTSVHEGHVTIDPALTSLLFAENLGHPLLKDFTRRELEVLSLISRGYTNSAIATALVIDNRTVQRHINNMYSKIKAGNGTEDRHLRVSAARLYLETSGELLTATVP
jgi:DNA-binding NarL/FixJ family response regulator